MAAQPEAVLITGANRGLGFEFARQYAAVGWRVFASCRSPEDARELQKLSAEGHGRVRVLAMDVSDTASVRAVAEELNNEAIDLLLNNAGVNMASVSDGGNSALGRLDYDAWARVLDINTLGPVRVAEAFVEHVARSRHKRIVTITSGMGSIEDNTSGGSYPYRSSKAAVNMAVKSLAIDLAPRGITCIVMNPGWVRTDMGGEAGKLSPAESIAAMRSVIAKLKPKDSGRFLNYTGKYYPW
jgi:NAD(P)-dependent dehydrogenase (short-subunit alcohol dehydrogenase family)